MAEKQTAMVAGALTGGAGREGVERAVALAGNTVVVHAPNTNAAFALDSGTPGTRAFDASEGTRLDPLKNRSYDLGSPKTVPALADPTPAPRGRR